MRGTCSTVANVVTFWLQPYNTTIVGSSPDANLKCKWFRASTNALVNRAVHINCPGILQQLRYGSHHLTETIAKYEDKTPID